MRHRPTAARPRLAAWLEHPERIVLVAGLVFGIAFALLTPPLVGYDEPIHFLRADQVAHGQAFATRHGDQLGGRVPAGLVTDLGRLLQDGLFARDHTDFLHHLGDRPPRGPSVFQNWSSAAVYSPVPYAPAAALMAIGRAFGASTLLLLYLGRLGGLVATVGLLALAVARMPSRRWMLAAVALLPVTVFQAAMLSIDGVTLALALLVVALALDVAATPPGAVQRGRLVEIALATVALGLTKPPYILFALAFAIPWRRHGGRVRTVITGSVVAAFALTAAWSAYASSIYVAPTLNTQFRALATGPYGAFTHVDTQAQERYVLHHPFAFLRTIGHTLSAYSGDLLRQTVAQLPLWVVPVAFVVVAYAILAATVAIPDTELHAGAPAPPRLGWRSRALLGAIAAVTFGALMLLAYTGWNAVRSPRVEAFQGRYLLPLIPLLLLAVPSRAATPGTGRESASARIRLPLTAAIGTASLVLLTVAWFGLRTHFY